MSDEIRSLRRRLFDLARLVSDWLWEVDTDGNFTYLSERVIDVLGFHPEELKGTKLAEIGSFSKQLDLRHPFRNLPMEARHRDGSMRLLEVSALPIFSDSTGDYVGARGTALDVTDKRHAEETIRNLLQRHQSILEAAGEGVFGVGLDQRVIFVNPAALELLGYTQDAFVGADQHKLIHHSHADGAPYPRSACPILETLATGKSKRVMGEVFWRSDDVYLPIEYVVTPLYEGVAITGAVIVFHDIRERLRQEMEIKRSNTDLEQFSYAISHDLQEPLRMISNYVQILEHRYGEKLDHDAKIYIGYASTGAQRMGRMIQGLLEFSRVRRDTSFGHIDLNRACREALDNLLLAVQESHAVVSVDNLPTVTGDHDQMVRLLQNLIANGIKYQPPGQAPHVTITARKEDRQWIISVADNGIGIDPQYFDRLFHVFKRLHGPDTYEGAGLGLALCRRIVEGHRGTIRVASEGLGTGTTFIFNLPEKTVPGAGK
jgi:PAS domain S-box-containing protein